VDLEQWDALDLPLPDRCIDVVLTNPPFGKRLEIPGDAAYPFYRRLLRELGRVLVPDGRLVLITSQTDAMQRTLGGLASTFSLQRRVPVLVRGERAVIYVVQRKSG
jgi:tRNA G10  N-methylase Trm11